MRSTIGFSPEEFKDNACNVCRESCYKMRRNFVTKCALSQNAQKFCYKMRVVTKCAEILLRNERCYKIHRNFVTKCARCYIMRSCYKMRLNTPQPPIIHIEAVLGDPQPSSRTSKKQYSDEQTMTAIVFLFSPHKKPFCSTSLIGVSVPRHRPPGQQCTGQQNLETRVGLGYLVYEQE